MNMIRYQPLGLMHRLHHDLDRITAKSSLGVLEVIIPKLAEIQPKKIDIQVD